MKIGNIELKNNVFQAPMAGVSDLTFRFLCKENDCGLIYSEMVSGKGILYDNNNTKLLLQTNQNERPVAIQLFGSDPEVFAISIKMIEALPIDIIDINMGCPVPKIFNNGEGSALMKKPELVGKIVKAASYATKKPITVKMRTGISSDNINVVELAKISQENGAAAITVHGRHREQYYSGNADWGIIKKVKDVVTIPVIGNGDIKTPEQAKDMIDQTGCDAVMIGRAAMGDPWIFKRVVAFLKNGEKLPMPTREERQQLAILHGRMIVSCKGEYVGVREMRKHLAWYTKGMENSAKLRVEINKAETYAEMEKLLKSSEFFL